MDDSLLHQSQIAGNQAVKFQKEGLYDLAIERHLLAADLLTKLQTKLPRDNSLASSLSYFIDHHQRQAQLDQVIVHFKRHSRTNSGGGLVTMNKKSLERSKTDLPLVPSSSRRYQDGYNVFEQPDSLLPQSCSSGSPKTKYTVRPKRDSEIIEEYKVMIQNLKVVVANQAEELMEARKKSQRDDETIRELRRRLEKYESNSSSSSGINFNLISSQYTPAIIPELPPLELPPDCDYRI